MEPTLLEKIASLCKRRGFIYPGSEIYGGFSNTWDFGPLGVELKNNIKSLWWKKFVHNRTDMYGLDGGIILSPKVWEASGHTREFTDPLSECHSCHKRFRSDQLADPKKCAACGGNLSESFKFNAMFKTYIGVMEDTASLAYLRPETAQAMFINFKNIVDSLHPKKLPFGMAQIGKSFRNEITAGNFIFRVLEFDQMEIECFIDPKNWEESFVYWQGQIKEWLKLIGIRDGSYSIRDHKVEELSHYSKRTSDFEFNYPFGVKELYGLAYRTDFDLKTHAKFSGVPLEFTDEDGEKIVPHVIEPSFGVERTILAVLCDAYREDEKRKYLSLSPRVAPYKAAVFPLLSNKEELVTKAKEVYELLRLDLRTAWDDRGNIGKRYYAQDEIGTPFCVTVDFQTLSDATVTVRDRDSATQERVKIVDLNGLLLDKVR